MTSKPIRIGLASVAAGGGHNSLRDLLHEELQRDKRFFSIPFTHPATYLDTINTKVFGRFAKTYNFLYQNSPSEAVIPWTLPLVSACKTFIEETKPDIILSTHLALTQWFSLLRHSLNYSYMVISAIPDWGKPSTMYWPQYPYAQADEFLVIDHETKQNLIHTYSIKPSAIIQTGSRARAPFFETRRQYETKYDAKVAVKNSLLPNLSLDTPIVLFAGGSGGTIDKTLPLISAVMKESTLRERYQYIIICGTNTESLREIHRHIQKHHWHSVFACSWLSPKDYALIQRASDVPILLSLAPATINELLTTSCGPFLIHYTRTGQEIANRIYSISHKFGSYYPLRKNIVSTLIGGIKPVEYAQFQKLADMFIRQQKHLIEAFPTRLFHHYKRHSLQNTGRSTVKNFHIKIPEKKSLYHNIFYFINTVISIIATWTLTHTVYIFRKHPPKTL